MTIKPICFILCFISANALTLHARQQHMDPSWMGGKWNADDKVFQKARGEVENVRHDFKKLDLVIAASRKQCDSKKPKALNLYKWAYATVLRSVNDFDFGNKVGNSTYEKKPFELFPELTKPDSYEFTRVRFLFTVFYDFPHRMMIPVGERLLTRDPNDVEVMHALIKIYQPQVSESQKTKGLRLIRQLDKMLPNDFTALKQSSFFYYLCWRKSKSKQDALESIQRVEKVYQMSRSETQKKLILANIKEMKEGTNGL